MINKFLGKKTGTLSRCAVDITRRELASPKTSTVDQAERSPVKCLHGKGTWLEPEAFLRKESGDPYQRHEPVSPVPRALTALWGSASAQDSIQARFLFSFPPNPYTVSHPTPVLATRNASACAVGEAEQEGKCEQERFPVRTIPSFFKEPRGNLRALWPRSCSFLHSKSLHFPPQKWALAHPAPQDTFVSETPLHERCFLPVLPPAPRLRSWFLHLPKEPPHQTRCLGKPEFVLAACHSRCASASEKTKCQNG